MKNWQEGNHFLFSVCSYVTLNKLFCLKKKKKSFPFLGGKKLNLTFWFLPLLFFALLISCFSQNFYHFVSASSFFCTP
uniref:Uncharacterized protein n=1 Tax=Urocitellus parryii TaxID=9999 RepID=A0A8D2KCG8_UROPR